MLTDIVDRVSLHGENSVSCMRSPVIAFVLAIGFVTGEKLSLKYILQCTCCVKFNVL